MNHREESAQSLDVAVIGMSGRFPGAANLAEFWTNLCEGVESIRFFSDRELLSAGVPKKTLESPDYVKAGSILSDIEMFDAPFFGINPREAESMDPQHRIFLECSWHALEDAGWVPEEFAGAIGVYAGCSRSTYQDYLNLFPQFAKKLGRLQIMLGNEKDYLPTHASYRLNLKGPSVCVQSSCSTSLVAVNEACQGLIRRQCDLAIAGGICIRVPQKAGYPYQAGGIFSPDGHSRVFDADAEGMVFGNGVGLVVLRRLADALADGDHIYAVIKGVAITNDGAAKGSFTAPSVEGQAAAILGALQSAGVHPDTISYVEAHGTGTVVGDPVEVAALTRAFRRSTDRVGFCALGSAKTNFGHLDHAAGAAGLIKTVLALKHRRIPPSLHFRRPNPAIDFEQSPFYVNTTLREWEPATGPRRAGVSGFSMGGTNVHLILEEAPAPEPCPRSRPTQLLVLSARSDPALDALAENLAAHLEGRPDLDLADVAYTSQVGRKAFGHRRFVLCKDPAQAVEGLRSPPAGRTTPVTSEASVAFLFSGQGGQYVNMARGLYRGEPVFREQVDACVKILKPKLRFDLLEVLYPEEGRGPSAERASRAEDALKQTAVSQAALFTVEYALAKLLMHWGVRPAAMIGHSLGEYVAACLAGVFPLETALALVAERGRLMQSLPRGAMLAVNLSEEEIGPLLGQRLSLAALNEARQVVVSGPTDAVAALEAELGLAGITCRRLQTSHAFHSAMTDPILEPFRTFAGKFDSGKPAIPYVANVSGGWAEATRPAYWADHIRRPVRFAEGLGRLLRGPCRVLLEVGPGKTLSSFARRHPDKSPEHVMLSSLGGGQGKEDADHLLETLGRLWLAGVRVDWRSFHGAERRRRVSLPGYPFERSRYWVDPAVSEKREDVADWFYAPYWADGESDGEPDAVEESEEAAGWLIFRDDLGVGEALADRLEQEGRPVVVVRPGHRFARINGGTYEIDPSQKEHYRALLGETSAFFGGAPGRVAHLWSLSEGPPSPDFEAMADLGFHSLVATAQALVGHNVTGEVRVGVVTNQLHQIVSGDELCPAKATMLGACKVISQEYSNLRCFSVDVGTRGADLVGRLIEEFEDEPVGTTAAYRDGQRLWQSYYPIHLAKGAAPSRLLRREGVYLITGGLGKIGLALAKALAESVQARVVLVGRSGLPNRATWDDWLVEKGPDDPVSRKMRAVLEIEALGGRVLALAADVSSKEQMRGVLDVTRGEFGGLHGVVHAAGVLSADDFRGLDQVDRASCERHFAAKVRGTAVLADLLRGARCDFCLLVSSLSSVLGGLGYLAYSSANAYLDSFAVEADRAGPTRWYSVNQDNWAFPADGASPADPLAILEDEGAETFLRMLAAPPARQVVVSTHDLIHRVHLWVERRRAEDRDEGGPALHARPELPTDYVAPRDPVERAIAKLYEETLGIHQIGIHDNFFELGGQSLLATELAARVRAAFDVELPLREFLEAPTVAGLALRVGRPCGKNGSPVGPGEALQRA
jgi:acyl transferase domain-containing protein